MTKEKVMITARLIRPIIHSLIILCIYRWAYHTRINTNILDGIDIWTYRVAKNELIRYSMISIVFFVGIGIIKKRYDLISIGLESTKIFFSVWWQWTVIMTCLAYFWQWFLFKSWISRFVIIQTSFATLLIIPIIEALWRRLYINWIQKFSHSILIISRDQDQSNNILEQIQLPAYYDIRKIKFSWQLFKKIQEDIVLLVWSYTQDELQEFIDIIRLQSKQLYHIWDNHFLEDVLYKPKKIGWIWALRYTSSQIEWRAALIKRICDIVWSSLGIILLSPIMLAVAIAIKIDSKGPVFYIQKRVGKNWETFSFIKFRSMYTHLSVGENYGGAQAEKIYQELINSDNNVRKGELAKIQDDPRVTKVWKVLRASSLDELPNLFSVLQGDMSLIWPRPHLPSEIANYKARQRRVLSIKPGITGYAQIHGRDSLSFDEEATKELEYIQNRSLRLDIYILFATVGVLFAGRGK